MRRARLHDPHGSRTLAVRRSNPHYRNMIEDEVVRLNSVLEGRYSVVREVGRGGMATVYLAQDLRHDRDVALKVLDQDLASRIGPARFMREIRITAKLRNAHILPLFDSGEAGGFLYFVMPYVTGGSLEELIARKGALEMGEAKRILRDVAEALSAAHALGVTHRDLKPANILLDGRHASVADFGIAKVVSQSRGEARLTTAATSLGTPTYMSPEHAAGDEEVDQRSDIYAFGAVAYEVLTGRPPFEGTTDRQVLLAHVTQSPEPISDRRSGIAPEIADAVMRCLAKEPGDRWQTIEELLPLFEPTSSTRASAARSVLGPRTLPDAMRRRIPVLVSAASVVAVLLLVWGAWARGRGAATDPVRAAAGTNGWSPRMAIAPMVNVSDDPDLQHLGVRIVDAMRQALSQHAPQVRVLSPGTADSAESGVAPSEAEALVAARERGATHLIRGAFVRGPSTVTLTLDVLDVQQGEVIRTLEPIEAPLRSVDQVVPVAGDVAAVVAMMLEDEGPDAFYLSHWPVPRSPVAFRTQQAGNRAFRDGRDADAISWYRRAIAEEPDWPTPYTTLRPALMNARRFDEWAPFAATLDSLRSRMTEDQHDFWVWLTAPRIADRIAAGERRLRRHGGVQNLGYSVALMAMMAGRVQLARQAINEQDREQRMVRAWPPMWRLDALIAHVEGDYPGELSVARDGLLRFPGDVLLVEAEARALVALDSMDAARDRFATLGQMPGDRVLLWHLLHDVALEARRHGHLSPSESMLGQLVRWTEAQGLGSLERAAAHYGLGQLAEVVALLEPSFSETGAWTGDGDTLWEARRGSCRPARHVAGAPRSAGGGGPSRAHPLGLPGGQPLSGSSLACARRSSAG